MAKDTNFNFTERGLAALPIPTQGQVVYHDSGTKDGLIVIVTYGGTKTYYLYMKFQGVPKRVKLGRVGVLKLYDARQQAHTLRDEADKGKDPSKKRRDSQHDITLKQFYEDVYKPEYSQVYKKKHSITNDDSIFEHRLAEFHNRKLMTIQLLEIERLHNKTKLSHSPYTANRVLSLIKHIYVIAEKHGYINDNPNPALGIRKFSEQSRDRFLQDAELERLFKALEEEQNEVFKNYVLVSLYSGQRRNNILTMRWDQVDLNNGFIYLPDTKNGEPMHVPMVEQLHDLLGKMAENSTSEWLFPSNKSASGHLEDPKRPWQNLLQKANISNLRLHDLRRTMGSYQAITGASTNIIGKSLGHKSTSATAVYARLTAAPVRESMQKAVDKMMGK